MSAKWISADRSLIGRPRKSEAKLAGIVRRVLDACLAWREQRRAAAELRSLSLYELKDIGLTPTEIDLAVRGEMWRSGRPPVSQYLNAIDERGRPTWPRLYRNA